MANKQPLAAALSTAKLRRIAAVGCSIIRLHILFFRLPGSFGLLVRIRFPEARVSSFHHKHFQKSGLT